MGLPLEAVSRAQRVAIATWRQRVEWAAKTPDCEEAQKFARVVLGEAATEVWKLWGNIDFKLLPPAAMRALCESLAEMMCVWGRGGGLCCVLTSGSLQVRSQQAAQGAVRPWRTHSCDSEQAHSPHAQPARRRVSALVWCQARDFSRLGRQCGRGTDQVKYIQWAVTSALPSSLPDGRPQTSALLGRSQRAQTSSRHTRRTRP